MNREVVQKYKKEFDSWLKTGKLLARSELCNNWTIIENPSWNGRSIYAINDKYAELRMAHADGKEIEAWHETGKVWIKFAGPHYNLKVSDYRIKTEVEFIKTVSYTNLSNNKVYITEHEKVSNVDARRALLEAGFNLNPHSSGYDL